MSPPPAELPRTDYPPAQALCALQVSDTVLYLVAAVVIYRFTGADVTSPALSASTKTLEKIAYGVAIPTIVIAGVINGHVAAVSFLPPRVDPEVYC